MVTYGKVEEARFTFPGAELKFEPTSGKAYDIRNDRKLIVAPSVFIQIGYKLF